MRAVPAIHAKEGPDGLVIDPPASPALVHNLAAGLAHAVSIVYAPRAPGTDHAGGGLRVEVHILESKRSSQGRSDEKIS